jgi:hypothetical protein
VGPQGPQGNPGTPATIAGADTEVQFNDSGALGASADFTWDGAQLQANNVRVPVETLAYAASVEIDFDGPGVKTVSLTGDIEFTTANLGAGKAVSVRIVSDGSARTFIFPAWTFISAEPAATTASKTSVLSLLCYGAADADVVAAFSEEP